MPVVAPRELHDDVPPRVTAGEADGAHRRFRAAGNEPHHLDRRYRVDHEFREFAPQQIREDGGSLGVRPESVLVEPEATSARADDSRLALGRATVLVNELLGADRIIAAELSDGTRVVARVHPDHGAAADDTVLLSAPAEAAHWYCRAEGRRITQAVAAA